MGSVRRHAAAVSKISSMRNNLISIEELEEIISLSGGQDIKDILSNFKAFNWINNKDDIYSPLEMIFDKKLQMDIEKLYHYYGTEYKQFLSKYLQKFEVEELKKNIRRVRNTSHDDIKSWISYTPSFAKLIDHKKLANAISIEAVIDSIYINDYKLIIKSLLKENPPSPFQLEMQLDQLYFRNLLKATINLSKKDKIIVTNTLETNIDILNANWLIRAKKNKWISSEEIFAYTLYRGKAFSIERLKTMSYMNIIELEKFILDSPYSFLVTKSDESIDANIDAYMMRLFNREKRKSPMSIASLLHYVHALEYQIKDLLIVKELSYLNQEIDDYLVGRLVKIGNKKS